jgi:hypothetical protein
VQQEVGFVTCQLLLLLLSVHSVYMVRLQHAASVVEEST